MFQYGIPVLDIGAPGFYITILSLSGSSATGMAVAVGAGKGLGIALQSAYLLGIGVLSGAGLGLAMESETSRAVGILAGKTMGIAIGTGLMGTQPAPPGVLLIFNVSARQPTTRRQDYTQKFWQRRVSASQQTIRMP
jgi:hypothetical protein